MKLTLSRGGTEVTFDDPTATALDLGAVLPQLMRALPDPLDGGAHVSAGGQNERAETWHAPGTTPVHPLGFRRNPRPSERS